MIALLGLTACTSVRRTDPPMVNHELAIALDIKHGKSYKNAIWTIKDSAGNGAYENYDVKTGETIMWEWPGTKFSIMVSNRSDWTVVPGGALWQTNSCNCSTNLGFVNSTSSPTNANLQIVILQFTPGMPQGQNYGYRIGVPPVSGLAPAESEGQHRSRAMPNYFDDAVEATLSWSQRIVTPGNKK